MRSAQTPLPDLPLKGGGAIGVEDPKRAMPRRLVPYVFVALWCAGFSFIKIGLAHAEPMTYLALGHGLCLLVFAALAAAIRPPLPASAAAWAHLVVVGVVIQFFYFALCYVAVAYGVSPGGLALIASLQPILVGLLAPGIVGEAVTLRRWLGLVLGLAGAALVVTARGALGAGSLVGLLGAVGALLAITAGTLYEKRLGTGEHVVTANLVQYAAGLAVSLPLALGFETMRVDWTPDFVAALAYLVVASSLISTWAAKSSAPVGVAPASTNRRRRLRSKHSLSAAVRRSNSAAVTVTFFPVVATRSPLNGRAGRDIGTGA